MAKIANSVIGTKPAEVDMVEKAEKKTKPSGIFAVLFAFVASACLLAFPAMAATPDINLTWVGTMFSSLITAANLCAAPAQSFIETWFPVIVEFVVYGVILGILGLIGFAFRGVIMAGVKMLENILK
jgi:hypothetical protein